MWLCSFLSRDFYLRDFNSTRARHRQTEIHTHREKERERAKRLSGELNFASAKFGSATSREVDESKNGGSLVFALSLTEKESPNCKYILFPAPACRTETNRRSVIWPAILFRASNAPLFVPRASSRESKLALPVYFGYLTPYEAIPFVAIPFLSVAEERDSGAIREQSARCRASPGAEFRRRNFHLIDPSITACAMNYASLFIPGASGKYYPITSAACSFRSPVRARITNKNGASTAVPRHR